MSVYVTLPAPPRRTQITFEDILYGRVDENNLIWYNNTNTVTRLMNSPTSEFDAFDAVNELEQFVRNYESLYRVDRHELYNTFHIPKKSGGLREINAPKQRLMDALNRLRAIFEGYGMLYHTSAFAYIKGRSCKDSITKHQQNNSQWFLKLDFKDFFGSTNIEFLMRMFEQIYPFNCIIEAGGSEVLTKALDLCMLDGGLPQGTPISPLLTNMMMIPIDHALKNGLIDFDKHNFVYTRYADDILISCKYNFQYSNVVNLVSRVLSSHQAPFRINHEKTRYGSRAGSNWNLGLMLNKDNDITVGHKRKKRLRGMLANYVRDRASGNPWQLEDVQVLQGEISYLYGIESEYTIEAIKFYNKKFNTDIMTSINNDLQQ